MGTQHPQRAQHPPPGDGASSAVFALLLLLTIGGGLVWLLMKPATRAELEFVLLRANSGPLVTSTSVLVAIGVLLALASGRKVRLMTSAVAQAHVEFTPKLQGRDRVLVYVPQLVGTAAALGAYAYYYAVGVTRWFFIGLLASPQLALLRGCLVLLNTVIAALLIPVYVFVFLNATGISREWRQQLLRKDRKQVRNGRLPDPGDYQRGGEKPVFLLGARESSASLKYEPSATLPSWVTYSAPTVFGGLLVFGKKGSGKTTLLLRLLEDALRFRPDDEDLKPSIVVVDQKGDIAEFVAQKAAEYGRAGDVTRLGVDTPATWNPFGALGPKSTALECRQVGFFMRCAMTAGSNMSSENSFWQDNADNLIFRSVHLLALAGEPVGFDSVYKLITSVNAQEKWRHDLFTRANYLIAARETQKVNVADYRQELKDTDRYFENDFTKLDPKVRTTIISVVSNFHQKFMTAQYARSFSGPATAPGHFPGFRDLIATGRVFVLDVRANEHGTVANALSMLVKLYYQAAVKTRDRYPLDAGRRSTVFVLDEAQSCITPSTANTEGDDKYLEMSRSFKAIDVYATQQFSSIAAAVGREMAQRIVGSFNNLVVYRHNDPALTEYLQKLVGVEERDERSVSVSESSSAAERNLLVVEGEKERDRQISRSVSVQRREKQLIEASLFKGMSVFEALGLFDNPRGVELVHFYTKPHFVDARTPHAEVLRAVEANR